MFLSHIDFDRCLKEGSFVDEIIIIPLNGKHPEFIMTHLNSNKNNWRLCQAKRIKGTDNAQFTKRTYMEKVWLDKDKYTTYFKEVIQPLINKGNELIKKAFPDVVFYE